VAEKRKVVTVVFNVEDVKHIEKICNELESYTGKEIQQ